MTRLLACSIAVLLSLAPNASLLCRAWCDGRQMTQSCHHHAPSAPTRVAATHGCTDEVAAPMAGVAETVRRSALLVALPADAPGDVMAGMAVLPSSGRGSPLVTPLPHVPLVSVLRI